MRTGAGVTLRRYAHNTSKIVRGQQAGQGHWEEPQAGLGFATARHGRLPGLVGELGRAGLCHQRGT